MLGTYFLSSFVKFNSLVADEKSLSQSEARVAMFVFLLAWKNRLGRRRWVLASCPFVKFCSQVAEEEWANHKPGQPSLFSNQPENTNLVEDVEYVLSSFFKFYSAVAEEKFKMSQLIRGQSGHLSFLIRLKNTNLVKEFKNLLLVKVHRICSAVSEEKLKMWKVTIGWPMHNHNSALKPLAHMH